MVFPSMPAVMKLNKLGTFSMSQLGQSKSAIADFMRSSMKKARETNENYEEGLLKLVRTLPTVRKALMRMHCCLLSVLAVAALLVQSKQQFMLTVHCSHLTCQAEVSLAVCLYGWHRRALFSGPDAPSQCHMRRPQPGCLPMSRFHDALPQVLKYLPMEKAKDARNFVQALQYWLGGNRENLENLLLSTAQVPFYENSGNFVCLTLLSALLLN